MKPTLFIADLHLQPSEPDTLALAADFFTHRAPAAACLFILGDFVEYWIGDDAYDGSLEVALAPLRQLAAKGTRTYLMHGNRDFLFGKQFADEHNLSLITTDSYTLQQNEQGLLLMHGDTLCTDDQEYMKMRHVLRDAQWQASFLSQTLSERLTAAQNLRDKSRTASALKSDSITDVNATAVNDVLQQNGLTQLLHGHTHRPAVHDIQLQNGDAAKRYVLGDWHSDCAIYAQWDANEGIELKDWAVERRDY